jgi:hypothetical protein
MRSGNFPNKPLTPAMKLSTRPQTLATSTNWVASAGELEDDS